MLENTHFLVKSTCALWCVCTYTILPPFSVYPRHNILHNRYISLTIMPLLLISLAVILNHSLIYIIAIILLQSHLHYCYHTVAVSFTLLLSYCCSLIYIIAIILLQSHLHYCYHTVAVSFTLLLSYCCSLIYIIAIILLQSHLHYCYHNVADACTHIHSTCTLTNHTHTHVRIDTTTYTRICTYIHPHRHTGTRARTRVCARMHECMHARTHAQTCMDLEYDVRHTIGNTEMVRICEDEKTIVSDQTI